MGRKTADVEMRIEAVAGSGKASRVVLEKLPAAAEPGGEPELLDKATLDGIRSARLIETGRGIGPTTPGQPAKPTTSQGANSYGNRQVRREMRGHETAALKVVAIWSSVGFR